MEDEMKMDESLVEGKSGRGKRPQPGVKFSKVEFDKLRIYGSTVNKTPNDIVKGLVKEFLESEEVRDIIAKSDEAIKAKERIAKKEEQGRRLLLEAAEEKKKYGLE